MLQQLKQLFSYDQLPHRLRTSLRGSMPHLWWQNIPPGSRISFGNTPQADISGESLYVSGQYIYDFEEMSFDAYTLSREKRLNGHAPPCVCHLIVAGGQEYKPYLALSRQLSQDDIERLFTSEDATLIKQNGNIRTIYARSHTPGLKDWITLKYHRQIHAINGKRRDLMHDTAAEVFDYSLFVSPDNQKAIEIEYHPTQGARVYVTIYRQMADIVDVVLAEARPELYLTPKKPIVAEASPPTEPHTADTPATPHAPQKTAMEVLTKDQAFNLIHEALNQMEQELQSEEKAPKTDPAPVIKIPEAHIPEAKALETKAPELKVSEIKVSEIKVSETKNNETNDIQQSILQETPATSPILSASTTEPTVLEDAPCTVECDLHVAARIIDEALRNDMTLEVVMRKILGLPISSTETVQFPIPLHEQDYVTLAERYGLKPTAYDAIRAQMASELADFAGVTATKRADLAPVTIHRAKRQHKQQTTPRPIPTETSTETLLEHSA